jgi:hypothetical protein
VILDAGSSAAASVEELFADSVPFVNRGDP